jgi:ATP-dependent helicase/nuclease subunit B
MRETVNMPSLEWRVGLMAHDFRQTFAGENLFLTRSTRLQGAPTLPSRLLQRLEAALEASGQPLPEPLHVSGLIKWKSPLFSLPRVRRLPVRVWTPGRSPGRQGRSPLGWSLSVTEMEFWRREP